MYTKIEIIQRSYREGKSQRQISRELGISRKTVKKYLSAYEQKLSTSGGEKEKAAALTEVPFYNLGKRSNRKLTLEITKAIDKLLRENAENLQKGLRKQLLKKIDIHEQLQNQGYDIGYTTVCNYIRSKAPAKEKKEAFIRQVYQPGESCEFDWREVDLNINGVEKKIRLSVFTGTYSNYRYGDLHEREDTLSFMEAHASFFAYTGGAYHQMIYDNMRVAVRKFVGKHEKEPTQALLQLRGHYGFSHRFCNIYSGNEKGHVERSVEYVRRKAFGPKMTFNSLDEARKRLQSTIKRLNGVCQQLSGKSADELFSEEKEVLYPAPTKIACSEEQELRVDKYATISYKTNRYSVPDDLVGQFVTVKISSRELTVFNSGKRQAHHERSYDKHQWIISIEHYLQTFKKKPGALENSVALASSGYLKQLYRQYFKATPRDFIDLLEYCYKHHIEDDKIAVSIEKLQQSCVKDITAERLKAVLGNKTTSFHADPNEAIAQMAKQQLSAQAGLF